MADYNHVSDGNGDGTMVGNAAADKVGFFGTTPAVQQTGNGAITLTTVTSSTGFGFVTATAASAAVQELKAISDALRTLGIIT